MKAWAKTLMWIFLGAGTGFFCAWNIQEKKIRKMKEERDNAVALGYKIATGRKPEKQYGQSYNDYRVNNTVDNMKKALDDYQGGGFSTAEELDEMLKGPYTEDTAEMPEEEPVVPDLPNVDALDIPQLHPQHFVPEIVTEDEYEQNLEEYEKEKLVFYQTDEVLYDKRTQSIIEEPDGVIGIGTTMMFGGDPHNPTETIFVRNKTYGTYFRIDRVDAAFTDAVAGACGPEDDEPEVDEDFWDDV